MARESLPILARASCSWDSRTDPGRKPGVSLKNGYAAVPYGASEVGSVSAGLCRAYDPVLSQSPKNARAPGFTTPAWCDGRGGSVNPTPT